MNNELITQTKMSELVGRSESNGRRWVKEFKEYIPTIEESNKTFYTAESLRIMKFLKKMQEASLTIKEIKQIINKEGIPNNKQEEQRIIGKYKVEKVHKDYDETIKETIPTAGEMMVPYLKIIKDGEAYTASEITEKLIEYFKLTEEQRLMKYENGSDSMFLSRVRSVRYSLKRESYIDEINKLTYIITNDGLDLLNESKSGIKEEIEELEKVVDPLTTVKENLEELNNELADNLLKQLRSIHWMKFEDIVVELLTVMGYGDGQVTQRSNDEGLDGLIKEDKLGLDSIYVQAKRYGVNNSVGRELVQSFSGALDGKGAKKGVFITTSSFTSGAKTYVEKANQKKIILIDGIELSKLMIAHNVGVDVNHTFVVKTLDYDYFKDE
ncbi:restriction endonuclease [Jeotgalibacillus haloalkalitolerans]|uniref:Restriction endonuclease n=1 Tax=Jeotgalibacillus haloalkalitolerans TaxID=3104292 RepID=A0ABU5KQM2_9BACL|nr:restriction endonuclease [Jeotgalibacillus sp. HH7-29]MDZ5713555.1 restriction endonuclease [Jeotgalibacillus sp. HH7-29]